MGNEQQAKEQYQPAVIVKLKDGVGVPYVDDLTKQPEVIADGRLNELVVAFATLDLTLDRLYKSVSPAQLDALVMRATGRDVFWRPTTRPLRGEQLEKESILQGLPLRLDPPKEQLDASVMRTSDRYASWQSATEPLSKEQLDTQSILKGLPARISSPNPRYNPPDFLTFFITYCTDHDEATTLVDALEGADWVEYIYTAPKFTDPSPINQYDDDPKAMRQNTQYGQGPNGYLEASPYGVNARYAWERGWGGQEVTVVDIERSWWLGHPDLPVENISPHNPSVVGQGDNHGTHTLGVLCARDNEEGSIGIAPNVGVLLQAYGEESTESSLWDSLPLAALRLFDSLGQIVLIEAQTIGGLPIEVDPTLHSMIQLLVGLDITVIEAAGNGPNIQKPYGTDTGLDLNQELTLGPSGAIMVGAGRTDVELGQHQRYLHSNYGSRVDCYAWGEQVISCGRSAASEPVYNQTFTSTSAAAAIIAGVAAVVQSWAIRTQGGPLDPTALRARLVNSGTGSPDQIGVMPNLAAIIPSGDVYAKAESPPLSAEEQLKNKQRIGCFLLVLLLITFLLSRIKAINPSCPSWCLGLAAKRVQQAQQLARDSS